MSSIRDEITRTFARFGKRIPDQPTTALPSLQIKSEIDQYRVLRKLGSGGMGHVFLALDTKLGRHVALKALSPQLTAEPAYVNRFKQEARAASALNHPNILTIYAFLETNDSQVIVSEYVEGMTLRTAMERNTLNIQQALEVVAQVASALAAAHTAGVVHRDLKPTNIMLRPDGYVKVIDFGLAKLAERSSFGRLGVHSATRPGTVVGTVRYMSPEQARGEEVDHRGDLWSLGVVLYELVAGIPPFEGTTDNHLIVAILDAPPKPIPASRHLPAGLQAVLNRALAKERKARYQSASELLADIHALQRTGGSQVTTRIARPAQWPKHSWVYSVALALALALIFVWWGPLGGRWHLQRPDWFDVTQTDRLTFEGDVLQASLSPDGRYLAYTTGASGAEKLHLKVLANGQEHTLGLSEQSYSGLTFAPDNRTLFFVLRDTRSELGTVYGVQTSEFGRVPEAMVLRNVDGPIAFSPDGGSFAFLRRSESAGSAAGSIFVAAASNAHDAHSIVTMRETEIKPRLSWSPAGIAATVYPTRLGEATRATICLFSPQGKLLRQFTPPGFRATRSLAFLDGGRSLLFAARSQGGEQWGLQELFLPTGAVHQISSDLAGFDDISVSGDSREASAVRFADHSAIYIAEGDGLANTKRLTPGTETYSSLAWIDDTSLVLPSGRSGSVNLLLLNDKGELRPLLKREAAVQNGPAVASGAHAVVYVSNAAHGGDDFNLWSAGLNDGRLRQLTSGSNMDLMPDVARDGRWVIYVSSAFGTPSLWKVPLAGGTSVPLSNLQARHPFLSPDGSSVLCELREPSGQWHVAIVSVQDGRVLRDLPNIPMRRLERWSPDGSAIDYVADQEGRSCLLRQSLSGGAPKLLLSLPEENLTYFAWSPNGTRLAYIRGRAESDVALLHRSPDR